MFTEVLQQRPEGLDGVGWSLRHRGAVRDVGPFFLIQPQPEGLTPPAVWEAARAPQMPRIQWTV